jgi:hypothetical protein
MRRLHKSEIVIPAEAGIQSFQELLDTAGVYPRKSGDQGDTFFEFCNYLA